MNLHPYVLEGCVKFGEKIPPECIIQAPTTQHTALLSALFALAAAVFAFYSNNGRKWNGFSHWNTPVDGSVDWRVGNQPQSDGSRSAPPKNPPTMTNERGNGG